MLAAAAIPASPCAISAGFAASAWADSGYPQEAVPAVAAWEHGFPVPAGALRNGSLGGATSVAPGRNYTLIVYDADTGIDAVTGFYAQHLPHARRTTAGREVTFITPGGHVRVAPRGRHARITLVIGPH
jgi:hypothetical protein